MKKSIQMIALLLISFIANAQLTPWYLTGNTPNVTDFLGSTNAQDVRIKTEQAYNINFYTNAGLNSFNNLRMQIDGSNPYVGIGTNAQAGCLHLGEDCIFFAGQSCNGQPFGGWRNWMQQGTFVCSGSDVVTVGDKWRLRSAC